MAKAAEREAATHLPISCLLQHLASQGVVEHFPAVGQGWLLSSGAWQRMGSKSALEQGCLTLATYKTGGLQLPAFWEWKPVGLKVAKVGHLCFRA